MRKRNHLSKSGILFVCLLPILSCRRDISSPIPADGIGSVIPVASPDSNNRYLIQSEVTSLVAGTTIAGFQDAKGAAARFNSPNSVVADAAGNLYISDQANNRIRKIAADGMVSTLAGDGSAAMLNNPAGLAIGPDGSLYVADQGNNRICKITGTSITTVAGTGVAGFVDGPGATARFNAPTGVAVDAAGVIYVADMGNNRIRRIATTGIVTQWVGDGNAGYRDGMGANAELNHPWSLTVTKAGLVYIADKDNHRIRKIYAGAISTLAGGDSTFLYPTGVTTDGAGNIFVADWGHHLVKKITPAGSVSTVSGSGVAGYLDSYDNFAAIQPAGLTIDNNGNIVVAEKDNQLVRRITPVPATTTLAGSDLVGYQEGKGSEALFSYPYGLTSDPAGNIYLADAGENRIRKITPDGVTSLVAGNGIADRVDGPGVIASFYAPQSITIDALGNLFVLDRGSNSIRRITPDGTVSTVSGVGNIHYPLGLAVDPAGNIYIAGSDTSAIKRITPDGRVTTCAFLPDTQGHFGHVAAKAGAMKATTLGFLISDGVSGALYEYKFSDSLLHQIAHGDPNASTPIYSAVSFSTDANDSVYIATSTRIAAVVRSSRFDYSLITIAGTGNLGFNDGPNNLAQFNHPSCIHFAANGLLYITEPANHRVRVLSK